jgi:hypothetical protein
LHRLSGYSKKLTIVGVKIMLGTKPKQEVYRDTLVIMSNDGTADIVPVTDKDEDRILGGIEQEYSVPTEDVTSLTGPRGRIFVYPSTIENIVDCQRIARLEKSTVLRQITQYEPPIDNEIKTFDFNKYLPWIIILVLILFLGFK